MAGFKDVRQVCSRRQSGIGTSNEKQLRLECQLLCCRHATALHMDPKAHKNSDKFEDKEKRLKHVHFLDNCCTYDKYNSYQYYLDDSYYDHY